MPTPNTRLMATEMTATTTVSHSAWVTTGSSSARLSESKPSSNVWRTPSPTGRATRSTRSPTTITRNTKVSELRPASLRSPRRRAVRVSATTRHPPLQHVERHDDHEGDQQEDAGHGGRGGQVPVLDVAEDPHRPDLGAQGQVPGQQHQRAVLADGASEAQGGASGDRREQGGQDDAPEDDDPAGAERGGGLLRLAIELGQDGLHRAHHEGQR